MSAMSAMSWGTFAYDAGVLVVAAIVAALISGGLAVWRWKPHLSMTQSASWRRMGDGRLCLTVEIRYRNTSNYRAIRVHEMVVHLQRLAPLLSDEAQKANHGGRKDLPQIDKKVLRWDKDNSRLLQPGGAESEIFVFFLPDAESRLVSFVAYTFVFQQKRLKDKVCSRRNQRGWGIATSHDIIDPQEVDMADTTPDTPEKVGGTESRPYEPPEPSTDSPANDDGGGTGNGSSPPPPPQKNED